MRRHPYVLAIGLFTVLASGGGAVQATDISGVWNFSVDVGDTHGDPVFSFQQKGETLAGTVTNPRGTQAITGTVKGDRAVFGFEGGRGGGFLKAVYTGTVESPRRMTGTVEFSGDLEGTGTWVATKR
jgi:hypothetical protein